MKLLTILSIASFLFVLAAANHGANEVAEQVVNPADWHGTFTSRNRYGGETYMCAVGSTLYGVYSNAGFFVGTITDRVATGVWFEGGRGDRNYYQGSFRITISDDNQEFDGVFNRLTISTETRWHETRLGAPYPSNPTLEQCFAPDETVENLLGSFYRSTETGALAGSTFICKDYWEQIYGSFHSPEGYIAGWSVDDATAFHGYRYDSTGQSGAYILRALTRDRVKGFYWRGNLAVQNYPTSKWEAFNRSAFTAQLDQCEQVGPGFVERLHGPDYVPYYLVNSSSIVSFSYLTFLIAALAALLF
jgi:hypothetical protein